MAARVEIDEAAYLTYDAHAADLLFQVISRRYEQKSIVITTNAPFKQWDIVFPNATCAVALIDRLTHYAEIITIEDGSYRKREAELAQNGAEAEALTGVRTLSVQIYALWKATRYGKCPSVRRVVPDSNAVASFP